MLGKKCQHSGTKNLGPQNHGGKTVMDVSGGKSWFYVFFIAVDKIQVCQLDVTFLFV